VGKRTKPQFRNMDEDLPDPSTGPTVKQPPSDVVDVAAVVAAASVPAAAIGDVAVVELLIEMLEQSRFG
jgi:hypothetical protein